MRYRDALGEVIRETRVQKSLTLRQVSSKGSLALGYLSEVERGHKDLSSELLEAVAYGLGVGAHLLVMEAGYRMASNQFPDTVAEMFDIEALVG
jgi:transcriptional regulator with XRE-family HTH domain